jgi:hypothetical protein
MMMLMGTPMSHNKIGMSVLFPARETTTRTSRPRDSSVLGVCRSRYVPGGVEELEAEVAALRGKPPRQRA